MKFKRLFILCALSYLSASAMAQSNSDEKIFFGGKIYSAEKDIPYPEAVGIKGGKIISVGSYKKVTSQMKSGAERINLNGKYMMPGLIDSHAHVGFAGFQNMTVNLPDNLKTVADINLFLDENIKNPKIKIGGVIYLSNVSLDYWNDTTLLDNAFNSKKYENTAVVLAGSDAHTGWANLAMLNKAGVNKNTLNNELKDISSKFGKDKNGALTGFVSESAWDKILASIPPVENERIEDAILSGARVMNSYGITAWMDPITNIRPVSPIFSMSPTRLNEGMLPAYAHLSLSEKLTGHVSGLALVGINSKPEIIKDITYLKDKFNTSDDFKLVGIKILQDGVIEYPSQTAKLSESYINLPGYSGDETLNISQFNNMVKNADANGLIVHFHAIGDRAVKEALDSIEYARLNNKDNKIMHSITHLEIVRPDDLKRFNKLNVAASMQMLWAGKNAATTSLLNNKVPDNLLYNLYPAGSLIKNKAIVAGASDWPVSTPDPFAAMYTAVTRNGEDGILPPDDERVSRQQIIQAYTLNAAKVIGREHEIGSIKVGKSADFVILDRDPELTEIDKLKETKVLSTLFKGKVVYKAAAYQ